MSDIQSPQQDNKNVNQAYVEKGESQPGQASNGAKTEEKAEKITNYFFGGLIILTFSGTFVMVQRISYFRQDLIEKNPGYNFPKFSDFYITFIMTFILAFLKMGVERVMRPVSELILAKKYKNPEDKEMYALGRVYIKKTATNIYKLIFFTMIVAIGYTILSQLDYFPTSLGGHGYMMKMFEHPFPDFFYHWKPEFFNFYYLTGLAYCIVDLVWLVFIYELQSDFVMMLLHHVCTISLITFSYLTNWSNIGCIVLFLHDFVDIFVYWTRIIVNSEIKSSVTIVSAVVLLIVFVYTRIYVFGELILTIIYGISWEWHAGETCLTMFLCFLYVMHVNWVYLILKKITKALFENKCEDTYSVTKVSKTS